MITRNILTIILSLALLNTIQYLYGSSNYDNNRYPLVQKPYIELPLGSVKAKGWLLEMLERQRDGATGNMDKLYPAVMGSDNGWLGGEGDQWERGPYWIDGLLPLAYILDDKKLKEKVQPWIEWALKSQREDGFFGPYKDYPHKEGLNRNNSQDWWPRMVILKIMQQYHSATGDERIIKFMSNYFKYQLNTLPEKPLNNWTYWAEYRACDNLQAVYWLYNITGDAFLLELGNLLHKQGYDFLRLINSDGLKRISSIHCVNLAQGIKEPVIYYQQDPDKKYIETVKKGFADIRLYHGQPQGMYGGDEAMHGTCPTQGSELCSAVELMFSLEKMMAITGDIDFADHLEKIAFNALTTQISDDFMYKQYYQQPNQVMITDHKHNFDQDHDGTDILFGLLSGYPCCASNMHQGWPKFTQSLWHASHDNGLAVLAYSPSEVTAKVGEGRTVNIIEETYYPMDDKITFTVNIADKGPKDVFFPLHLRIPKWCKEAVISVNGNKEPAVKGGNMAIIRRKWKSGDKVELELPMEVSVNRWHENAIAFERGPLVYALKMEENWQKEKYSEEKAHFGEDYYKVTSTSKWNYGIPSFNMSKAGEIFKATIDPEKQKSNYPWNTENAPIEIKLKAFLIPYWQTYNEMAGPIPFSPIYNLGVKNIQEEEITLIPYGCTTLRISEFPVVNK